MGYNTGIPQSFHRGHIDKRWAGKGFDTYSGKDSFRLEVKDGRLQAGQITSIEDAKAAEHIGEIAGALDTFRGALDRFRSWDDTEHDLATVDNLVVSTPKHNALGVEVEMMSKDGDNPSLFPGLKGLKANFLPSLAEQGLIAADYRQSGEQEFIGLKTQQFFDATTHHRMADSQVFNNYQLTVNHSTGVVSVDKERLSVQSTVAADGSVTP